MVTVIDMELGNLFGLPAHPLLVHVPVVLVPTAALIAVVMAVRPAWLDRFGWWLVGISGVGFIGALLAAGSGEELQEKVKRSDTLRHHIELGESARNVSALFFGVVVVVVAARHWMRAHPDTSNRWTNFGRSRAGGLLMAALLVVSAGASAYLMADAGHQGAKATWEDVGSEKNERNDKGEQHDEDDDND